MILGLIEEAVEGGARVAPACTILGVAPTTIQRWKRQCVGEDRRAGPASKPRNALTDAERAKVLQIANSPQYRDKSPKQIVPALADLGVYIGSEASFYRILREAKQLKHRESSDAPSKRHRPTAYTASGPNQVWSWDITYLRTSVKGSFFYLYMVLDVWSRKIVGYEVHGAEDSNLAADLMEAAHEGEDIQGKGLVLHADNGSSMKSATMLAKLQALGIATSFSRPSVSNDNPYSESAFRTAKYRPEYPTRPFESLEQAREWAASFVAWYNTEHLHSSIRFVTPEDRHTGRDVAMLQEREQVYAQAKDRHPERWSGSARNWSHVETVILNPEHELEVRLSA